MIYGSKWSFCPYFALEYRHLHDLPDFQSQKSWSWRMEMRRRMIWYTTTLFELPSIHLWESTYVALLQCLSPPPSFFPQLWNLKTPKKPKLDHNQTCPSIPNKVSSFNNSQIMKGFIKERRTHMRKEEIMEKEKHLLLLCATNTWRTIFFVIWLIACIR